MRAYLLGYGFTVGPRVVSLLMHHLASLVRGHSPENATVASIPSRKKLPLPLLEALTKTLKAGLEVHRFATFCAALVGGSTLLQV